MSKVFLFLLVLGIIKGVYNTVFSMFHAIRWGLVATSSPDAIVNHNAATELANMNLRVLFVLIAILWIQLFVMYGDGLFATSSLK
jgi:hypothetical protein